MQHVCEQSCFQISFSIVYINECSPNSCMNGGICTDLVNGFSCSCIAGYNGDDCSNGKYQSKDKTLHTYIHYVLMKIRVVVR